MTDQLTRERIRTLRVSRLVLNLVALYLLLPIVALILGAVGGLVWWVSR